MSNVAGILPDSKIGAKLRPPILGVLVLCNAALALLMTWYIVATMGLSPETDAYFASGALPQIAFLLLSSTILPVLVPLLAKRTQSELVRDASTFLITIVAAAAALAVIAAGTAGLWVPMIFRGFSEDASALAIELTRIQAISMVLNAAIVGLWLFEHARQRFIWIEVTGLAANLAGIVFLVVMTPRFGVRAAAWNVVFFNVLKVGMLLPSLGVRHGMKWHSATIREAWALLRAFVPGQAYIRSEPLIDRPLASIWGVGGLSLLYIAQQMYGAASLIIGKILIAPILPRLAVESLKEDGREFRRSYRRRIAIILLLALAGTVAFAAAGMPAFRSIIGHGGITEANVETLYLVMLCLSGAFAGSVATQLVSGSFYAKGDTATPTKVSVAAFTLYLPVKVAMFWEYGLVGLALTISAYHLSVFVIQMLLLERAGYEAAPSGSLAANPES